MESWERTKVSRKNFEIIQRVLGLVSSEPLQSTRIESPVFVSIDLEYTQREITQLGISTFDSQLLIEADLPSSISSEYPISSTLYSTKVSKYKERRRKPSHLGEKNTLVPAELRPLLGEILTPEDDQGRPRDVVLVGHMITNEIRVINDLCGLNITCDIPSVKIILDTQKISNLLLRPTKPLSLKNLLIALDLQYIGLHNAAHDSRYTLRALLFMFCKVARQQISIMQSSTQSMQQQQQYLACLERLTLTEVIARFHRRREPILWCENSPRVKFVGNSDLLDCEYDDSDAYDGGLLAGIF